MFGINHFAAVDYIVVAGTLLFSLIIGLYYALCQKQDKEEMLVGGRSMNPIPIAASMMVTYLSAITILGHPAEVYNHGIQILNMSLLSILCIPISTLIFVKVFYKKRLTSVYQYLEERFDSVMCRCLASLTFIIQVVLINGVVLYAPTIALQHIIGLPTWISILGIGVIGTVYTSFGGIKAVIWTDCFQFLMIAIGLAAIMIKGFSSAGGIVTAFNIAKAKDRLVLFDFTFDPFMRHNFWNFLFGYGFTIISLYGTHQPQVQRYCSLPTFRDAVKALLFTIPLKFFTMSLVVLTGISVFATYSGCCPVLRGEIKKADAIIPYFVIHELAFIPGLMGLFVSCIFSAVLSTISSTLNSLAAVTWEDFLAHFDFFKNFGKNKQTLSVKLLAIIYGVITMGVAYLAQNLKAIFQATMVAVGATSGPLGGIFFCALFMPCMNKWGAMSGMIVGLCSMMYVALQGFFLEQEFNFNRPLPTDLLDCPPETNLSNVINSTRSAPPEMMWPTKIYTISYTLYPFVGSIITASVGLLISMLTGGFCATKKVKGEHLHPLLHRFGYEVSKADASTDKKDYAYSQVNSSSKA